MTAPAPQAFSISFGNPVFRLPRDVPLQAPRLRRSHPGARTATDADRALLRSCAPGEGPAPRERHHGMPSRSTSACPGSSWTALFLSWRHTASEPAHAAPVGGPLAGAVLPSARGAAVPDAVRRSSAAVPAGEGPRTTRAAPDRARSNPEDQYPTAGPLLTPAATSVTSRTIWVGVREQRAWAPRCTLRDRVHVRPPPGDRRAPVGRSSSDDLRPVRRHSENLLQ